ncbi:MAG: hypothetical protein JNM94_03245 [Phycisphaerae bacterium]|nr:hypothetical protein [Phycisphaerae bacterium]
MGLSAAASGLSAAASGLLGAALGRLGIAACGALLAAAAQAQVLELPIAETVTPQYIGPTRADPSVIPFTTSQSAFPFGDVLALVGDELFVVGPSTAFGAKPIVAVWRAPNPEDPPGLRGWRKVEDIAPISTAPASFGQPVDFGRTLATDGTWLFVGAPLTAISGLSMVGTVHVYRREPGGAFMPVTILTDPWLQAEAQFGSALAFDGTTLLVGVPKRRDPAGVSVGGADRFVIDGTSIEAPLSLISPLQAVSGSGFGAAVAVEGSTFALSSTGVTLPGVPGTGAVLLLHADDTRAPRVTVEALLTSPTVESFTSFGASIAMDLSGDVPRLAVTSPREDVAGLQDAGVVRLYEKGEGAWDEVLHVAGEAKDDQLRYVSMARHDGRAYLSICAAPAVGVFTGRYASLYEIVGGAGQRTTLTFLARATSSDAHTGVGRQAALGGGRWAVTGRDVSRWYLDEPEVRVVPLASAATDCDGDATSDLQEVLQGAADCDDDGVPDSCPSIVDCNADGIPDACNVEWTPTLPPPHAGSVYYAFTGTSPVSIPFGVLWVVRVTVPPNADGVLRGIAADWTTLSAPNAASQPGFFAVYDDPDQDGQPLDATLRGAYVVTPSMTSGDDRAAIEPIAIGPPGRSYFIGVGIVRLAASPNSLALRANAAMPGMPSSTWMVAGDSYLLSELNVADLAANDTFELFDDVSTFVCDGLFRSSLDANGDGVVDECACNADLTGDGAVGADDLAALLGAWGGAGGADLDGDGVVGPEDLGGLLGAWGPCPGR